jgi:hypothetical protein
MKPMISQKTHSELEESNQRSYRHSDHGAFEQGLDKEDLAELSHSIYGCK